MKRMFAAICAAAWLALGFGHAAEHKREFYSGYAGSLPSDANLLARTYFNMPAVRQLIYRMEASSVARADVESALKGSGATVEDLLRVKLVREEKERLSLAFAYFTAADMRLIEAAVDKHVPSLVATYAGKRDEFDRLFAAYPAQSVSRKALAYALIIGMSLNWDGLKLTLETGRRKPNLVSGEGWQYSFWASEDVPDLSKHGYYWGSSSLPIGPRAYPVKREDVHFWMSSFGDPYSDPRMNFPDLIYLPVDALAPPVRAIAGHIGTRDESLFGNELTGVLGTAIGEDCGRILLALHDAPASRAALRAKISAANRTKLDTLLALLVETQAIGKAQSGRYALLSPALSDSDAQLVRSVLGLSRQILEDWLSDNYDPIRSELNTLTALRQGVPYAALFTQIWHELFGRTTRDLVASGFAADPAGAEVKYKGSLPLVWAPSLFDLDAQ